MVSEELLEEFIIGIELGGRKTVVKRDARGVEGWMRFQVKESAKAQNDRVVFDNREIAIEDGLADRPASQIVASILGRVSGGTNAVAKAQAERLRWQRF